MDPGAHKRKERLAAIYPNVKCGGAVCVQKTSLTCVVFRSPANLSVFMCTARSALRSLRLDISIRVERSFLLCAPGGPQIRFTHHVCGECCLHCAKITSVLKDIPILRRHNLCALEQVSLTIIHVPSGI